MGASPAFLQLAIWQQQHRRDLRDYKQRKLDLKQAAVAQVAAQAAAQLAVPEADSPQAEADPRESAERFARALELLGADKVETRLGSIYALELVIQDSPRHARVVVETLAAFVRQNAPLPLVRDSGSPRGADRLGEDIQAALTVLGRSRRPEGRGPIPVDLSSTNLRRASLVGADLEGVNLKRAILRLADLEGANLRRAVLAYAELSPGAT